MDFFGIPDPDPHYNKGGSATLIESVTHSTCPMMCWKCGWPGSSLSMSECMANSVRAFQGGWEPWRSTGFRPRGEHSCRTEQTVAVSGNG